MSYRNSRSQFLSSINNSKIEGGCDKVVDTGDQWKYNIFKNRYYNNERKSNPEVF